MKNSTPSHSGRCHFFLLPAALLLICMLSGCGANTEPLSGSTGSSSSGSTSADARISDTDFCLDTVITITLNGTDDQALLDSCFDKIREYEALLSRTVEDSDVWRINNSNGKPVKVSEETASLLRMALDFSELSGGAFDITIAPVVSLWNFTGEEPHSVPGQAALHTALSHVDYRNVELDGTTVTLRDPDASIDLGGIAKGYIADRIKEYLVDNRISSGMIDLGGNILTIGTKPDGHLWNIGVRRPFGDVSDAIAVVPVDGQSVVTSGTYERYFEIDGTVYHHILNPEDGYPADNDLSSVTIVSDSSARCDALSTTCFVLGLEEGMELIESLDGVEAMFITTDLKLHRSSGFPE